jgi:UDP-N-acetylglucosamine 2-epimerase (non-hydrolysing)
MLDQVLDVFQIVPDTDFNLMRPNQTLSSLTASAITALDEYLAAEKPDLILVQGDTTTVFVASLAAFYRNIPVGHVEAGLRTGNMQAPWPEEANRVLTTDLATLHFVPTALSRENLLREGISSERIYITGNTVIDALFLAVKKVHTATIEIPGLNPKIMDPASRRPLVLTPGIVAKVSAISSVPFAVPSTTLLPPFRGAVCLPCAFEPECVPLLVYFN